MLAYVHDLSPFVLQLGDGFGVRWYGLAYAAAFVCGFFLYRWLARKGYADLPPAQVGDFILLWVVLGTVIGGRLGYVLFYGLPSFLAKPWTVLFVWEGGMSAHGGMLGLVVATWLYSRRYGVSWLNLGDNLVVVAPIGLFFGRCANFINGELYGRIATIPWGVRFPKELYDDPALRSRVLMEAGDRFGQPVSVEWLIASVTSVPGVREIFESLLPLRHPSQLYQAGAEGLLLFLILFFLRTRVRLPNGVLTGLFFLGYSVFRIAAEFFREPDAPLQWGLTQGQFLSVFLALLGVAFVMGGIRKPSYPKARA